MQFPFFVIVIDSAYDITVVAGDTGCGSVVGPGVFTVDKTVFDVRLVVFMIVIVVFSGALAVLDVVVVCEVFIVGTLVGADRLHCVFVVGLAVLTL